MSHTLSEERLSGVCPSSFTHRPSRGTCLTQMSSNIEPVEAEPGSHLVLWTHSFRPDQNILLLLTEKIDCQRIELDLSRAVDG